MAKSKGIYRKKKATEADEERRVVDFSYQNDSLAQMIIEAWTDQNFQDSLVSANVPYATRSNNAKQALAARGIYLSKPIVISEDEYNGGWDMKDDDEVAFVLPKQSRAQTPYLLETAKLLMAYTPHGI